MTNIALAQAIVAIDPNAQISCNETTGEITWHDENPNDITDEQIAEKRAELQTELNATQYQRDRGPIYPKIGDQLDALYHAGVFPDDMAAQLKAVKDKYPKP